MISKRLFVGRTAVVAAVMIALALVPLVSSIYWHLLLFVFFVYLAISNMWNLLAGYSGLISLGQPAFIGLGAYTTAVLAMGGMSPFIGIVIGGAVAGTFAIVISVPMFRMKGIYFAIGSWCVAEALRTWFNTFRPSNASAATWGGAGIPIKAAADISISELYYSALIIGVSSTFVLVYTLNSKMGLGLKAIRDNELAARTAGVNVFRSKFFSFLVSAFLTGIAGGIFYIFQGHVEPSSAFSVNWTILMVTGTIIGGYGTIVGPIVGAAISTILQQTLASIVGINLIVQGLILVAVMSFAPRGIVGTILKHRSFFSSLRLWKDRKL